MKNKELQIATTKINRIISINLKNLLDTNGITQTEAINRVSEHLGFKVDRTTLNRYLNTENPKTDNLSIPILLAFCKCFNVSLESLFIEETEKNNFHIQKSINRDVGLFRYPTSEVFVENPKSSIIKKYIQTYNCYYYSTVSSENRSKKPKDSILTGTLVFEANGMQTKATLKIDTKTCDENGNANYKIYTGNVVICPSIQVVHCIMYNVEGEFCFLVFRYSHLFFYSQECRLAEVLSTSSTLDKRYPVVHRMLLSKEKIKEDDLWMIAPYLNLNCSKLTMNESALLEVSSLCPEYHELIEEIFKNDSELMYSFKEKDIVKLAKDILSEEECILFLNQLYIRSSSNRYNKISPTADKNIRELLGSLGYFQKNKQT